LVTTSHAKCRQCGQARHKIARFNICQGCWEETKPSIRAYWRGIKERRALRRAVDTHVREQQELRSREELQMAMTKPSVSKNGKLAGLWDAIREGKLPADQRETAIARIRTEGVPAFGSEERGLYMSLFRGRERNEWQDNMIARLYSDSDVPVSEIMRGLSVDANEVQTVRKRRHLGTREDTKPFRPSAHMLENEELVIDSGQLLFRDGVTGLLRPVWTEDPKPPEPEPEPQPAPPAPEPVPVPVASLEERRAAAGRTRTGRFLLTPEQEAEVVRLYQDRNVPVDEIKKAYGIASGGHMYSILKRHGISPRSPYNKPPEPIGNVDMTQHLVVVAGPPPTHEPHQLNLGQAPLIEEVRGMTKAVEQITAALAVPANVTERAWAITYVATATTLVNAPTLDEAVRKLREKHGADVDIVQIQRT